MTVISKQDALAQGLKRYYTGVPCDHGHLSERNVHSACLECSRGKAKIYAKKYPEKVKVLSAKRMLKDPDRVNRWRAANPEKHKAGERRRKSQPEPGYPCPESKLCECCGRSETRKTRSGKIVELSLDHDHVTGEFRGWLCGNCNHAIGLFGDDKASLVAALAYFSRGDTK